jgi:protein tyrosine kinase modulator
MMPGRQYTPATIRWILKKRAWLMVGPMVLFGAMASAVTLSMRDRYRAQTLILVVPQRVPENYVRPAVSESIDQRLQAIGPQIMSESRLQRIVEELDLYKDKRNKKGGLEEIVEDMRSDMGVEIIKGDLFRVTYSGTDPYKVMQVTQRLASLFVEENLKDREQTAVGTNRFLESQLDNTRRQLEEQERKLQEYRQTHAGELPSQVGANLQVLQNASFQLQTSEEALSRDRDRRLELERVLADLVHEAETTAKPARAADAPAPPSPQGTGGSDGTGSGVPPSNITYPVDAAGKLAQLQALQQTLQNLELRLRPDHPDVIRTKRLIADLQSSIPAVKNASGEDEPPPDPAVSVRNARMGQVRAQIANLDKEITRKTGDQERLKLQILTLQRRVESEPARESELVGLTRDYDTLKLTYQSLLAKKEESGIAANLERQQVGQQFKTLDPARLPEKPYGPPRLMINLGAAGAGLALGLGLTLLIELRDQSFRTAVEVVPVLSLPVLASVPAIMTGSERRKARRLVFAGITAFMISLSGAGYAAYHFGWVDLRVFKLW